MKARKINIKTLEMQDQTGASQKVSYVDFLKVVVAASGQNGMTTDDVLKAVDINMELKAANGAVHLSEQDYNWLLGRLNNTVRWTMANEQIVEFIKDVRAAEVVDIGT